MPSGAFPLLNESVLDIEREFGPSQIVSHVSY